MTLNGLAYLSGAEIVVAMSGGVDSTVAALVLKQAGADVIGATLDMHDCPTTGAKCCSAAGPGGVAGLAAAIGIPHHFVDARAAFVEKVLEPAWGDYASGRTPSPCIMCNQTIKFGLLREWASSNGATYLATGHYVATTVTEPRRFLRPTDLAKDQTYFLCRVRPDDGLLFPLSGLTKPRVREIARGAGLVVADAPESQDACYMSDEGSFAEALRMRFGGMAMPGRFVDADGTVLGPHRGIHMFTVGQRRGVWAGDGRKRWVLRVDGDSGDVILTTDPAALDSRAMIVSNPVTTVAGNLVPGRCLVSARHGQAPVPAACEPLGDGRIMVTFESSVRAVTPGQAAAFYEGNELVGGAWIDGPC